MMTNYIEKGDKIVFHPGYYIKEIIEETGLTQEDFAKRLDTTPKNLSLLIRGEQSLSIDIAMKLARMIGTSVDYWLNLQKTYDALLAEFKSEEELAEEREVFRSLDYKYFRENFGLPNLPRQIDEQIERVRSFLKVATLCALSKRDMAVSFRSASGELGINNIVKANTMVQIATNIALNQQDAPKFSKTQLQKAVEYVLTLTTNHDGFCPKVKQALFEAGVIFVVLPNLPGSRINGATKKIGNNVMLMVNDRQMNSDTFWFTLFHEIGHILNGSFGISFTAETGTQEDEADRYAAEKLIPSREYEEFVSAGKFGPHSIILFAETIRRDPGIVLGRLQKEEIVRYDDLRYSSLRHKYKVRMS